MKTSRPLAAFAIAIIATLSTPYVATAASPNLGQPVKGSFDSVRKDAAKQALKKNALSIARTADAIAAFDGAKTNIDYLKVAFDEAVLSQGIGGAVVRKTIVLSNAEFKLKATISINKYGKAVVK
jgi:hypothetical protein